jgi:Rha family phage regulatory protein
MTAISIASPVLSIVDGHPTTSSIEVAKHFGKLHKHVLDKIADLIAETPADFNGPNFRLAEYTDEQGKPRPAYRLTRDGFTLLAMGFTGKRALTFKLAYIEAFNQMEAALRSGPNPAADMLKVADLLARTAKALRESGVPKQIALSMALDEVHMKTGVRMLPNYTPERITKYEAHSQIVNYVKNARRYANDRRFGPLCAQGVMPHSKLLKLVAVPAQEFAVLVGEALLDGIIQKVCAPQFSGTVYTLTRQ